MPRTKGVSFSNARTWIDARFGAEAYERVLARLTPEEALDVRSSVAMGWYELELHSRMLRAIDDVLGNGDLTLLGEFGHWEAERDLTVIHRIVLRFASPSIILEKMPGMWKRYYDHGHWEIARDKHLVVGRLHGWRSKCAALRAELTAWMQRAFELVGARDVRIDQKLCQSRGDPHDEWHASWR